LQALPDHLANLVTNIEGSRFIQETQTPPPQQQLLLQGHLHIAALGFKTKPFVIELPISFKIFGFRNPA
jgi:hypothetical protein